ncbi:MAG: B12-binding domain-containing radical SAM protein [Planctomycetes bacterium]|nr:B12-binding domain-containing radical SAM protein [Planctomycetota bacterium]
MNSNQLESGDLGENSSILSPITLIRPPIVSSKASFSAPATPPLGLAYLSAALKKENFKVCPIDALGLDIETYQEVDKDDVYLYRGLSIEKIIALIPEDSLMIGISCMFSQEWLFVIELLEGVHLKYPDIPIVVGGEHVSALYEEVLHTCSFIKACAIGEGEETLVDLAFYFLQGGKGSQLSGIAGTASLDSTGSLVLGPKRKRIQDLDEMPLPDWDSMPIEVYLSSGYGHGTNQGRTMPLLGTRGCPYSCTFCSNKQMWTTRYVTRTPSKIVDEMEFYRDKYNVSHFDFYDLTAIVRKEWYVAFAEELIKRGMDISYSLPSGTRSEAIDEEVTALMHKTKCRYLVYAAETGSQRILKLINKKVSLKSLVQSMRSAKKNQMSIRCNLMLGFPDETRLDVMKTVLFQLRLAILGVDDVPLYMFSPYPGSHIFNQLRESGDISELNKEYYEGLICQMDLFKGNRIPTVVSKRELIIWRIVGMTLFYSLSYLFFPKRIIRTYVNIFKVHKTTTVFEQRIVDLLRRRKANQHSQ